MDLRRLLFRSPGAPDRSARARGADGGEPRFPAVDGRRARLARAHHARQGLALRADARPRGPPALRADRGGRPRHRPRAHVPRRAARGGLGRAGGAAAPPRRVGGGDGARRVAHAAPARNARRGAPGARDRGARGARAGADAHRHGPRRRERGGPAALSARDSRPRRAPREAPRARGVARTPRRRGLPAPPAHALRAPPPPPRRGDAGDGAPRARAAVPPGRRDRTRSPAPPRRAAPRGPGRERGVSGPGLEAALASRRIAVCVGPGGVGKTTLAASLALAAARRGPRAGGGASEPPRGSGVPFREAIAGFLLAFEGMAEGFRERARRVRELLLGPEAAFVLAATPARESVAHALAFLEHLATTRVPLAAIVVNRVRIWPGSGSVPARVPLDGDVEGARARLADAFAREGGPDFPAREAARAALDALAGYASLVQRDAECIAPLEARAAREGCALRRVPEFARDVHDLDALAGVADHLFAREPQA